MAQNHPLFRFGPFLLDLGKRQLLRGSEVVKLYPKEFDTLAALVARSGEVVEKEELLRLIWRDAVVEEGNLTTQISHLRKVLGGATANRDYIVTIPGRGYEFVATVTRQDDEVRPKGRRRSPLSLSRRSLLIAGLVFAATVVAVAVAFLTRRSDKTGPAFQQLTFGQGPIWSARFAPDGRSVVYGAAWDGRGMELFTTRPGSPESHPLGHRADLLAISPLGELAVSIERRVTRAWESTGTLARLGMSDAAPRQVLSDVKEADWSADGADLVVVRRAGSADRLEYQAGTLIYEVQGFIMAPRVSRTSGSIAFLQRRSGDESVELVDPGGAHRTLAGGLTGASGLAWSARGDEVLFTVTAGGSSEVHAVSTRGARRLLFQTPGEWSLKDVAADGRVLMTQDIRRGYTFGKSAADPEERDLSWLDRSVAVDLSTDGGVVLLAEVGAAGGKESAVYIRNIDGSPPVRLGDGKAAAMSPDRQWVIANRGSAPERLVLLPTGPGAARVLPNGAITDYYRVRWLPDNQRIVFGAIEPGQERRAYIQDIAGGLPRPWDWPGGATAVFLGAGDTFVAPGKGRQYSIYSFDGTAPRPIPNLTANDHVIQGSVDGRTVFVLVADDTTLRIDRLELVSGRRSAFRHLRIANGAGIMQSGPEYPIVLMTPDGGTYVYNYLRVLSNLYLVDGLQTPSIRTP